MNLHHVKMEVMDEDSTDYVSFESIQDGIASSGLQFPTERRNCEIKDTDLMA